MKLDKLDRGIDDRIVPEYVFPEEIPQYSKEFSSIEPESEDSQRLKKAWSDYHDKRIRQFMLRKGLDPL